VLCYRGFSISELHPMLTQTDIQRITVVHKWACKVIKQRSEAKTAHCNNACVIA